jgi:hypothetical protein
MIVWKVSRSLYQNCNVQAIACVVMIAPWYPVVRQTFPFMVVSFNGKENGLPKETNVPSVGHVRYMIESKIL